MTFQKTTLYFNRFHRQIKPTNPFRTLHSILTPNPKRKSDFPARPFHRYNPKNLKTNFTEPRLPEPFIQLLFRDFSGFFLELPKSRNVESQKQPFENSKSRKKHEKIKDI